MKILVVRFRQIGDAILSSVICKSLKKSFPNAQIDYVLYEESAPLFNGQSYIDNVITISKEERKNIFKYLKKVWKVTREKYDIVIDIMSTPKSEMFTLFSTKAKYKIGRKKKKRGFTYTHKIEEPSSEFDKMEKFLKMLEPLKRDGLDIIEDKYYEIEYSNEEIKEMNERMKKASVDFNKILIPMAITSRKAGKIYPKDLMKEVIQKILERYDSQIILFYSPNEKSEVLDFHKELGYDKRVISSIETKSIRELGAIFKQCDIFVGNEGGPRHLAQAVGLPTVSIFGPNSAFEGWLTKDLPNHFAIGGVEEFSKEKYKELTFEEKYRLIEPEDILKMVDKAMNYVAKK